MRNQRGRVGVGLLIIAAAAFTALIGVNLATGQLFQIGKIQILLALLSLWSGVASIPPIRRRLMAALARSRAESPLIETRRNDDATFLVIYTLWFAAVTSVGEIAYWTFAKEVTKYQLTGFEFMWQIPLGYAIVFSVVSTICGITLRGSFKPMRAFLLAGWFVMMCGWLAILIKGLHPWATLVLAAGVANLLTQASRSHAYLLQRVVSRSVAAAVIMTFASSIGFSAWPQIRERSALSRLPLASAHVPNVLLIVLDTVRAKSLSLYGYHRATSPNLDRFARRGTVFNRAFATAPWTLPSHGSMFTGRHPHELSAAIASPLDATHPTIAEALAGHGYVTAGFVANTWYGKAAFGLARGFLHYEVESTTAMTSFMKSSFGRVVLAAGKVKEHFETHDNFDRKSAEEVNRAFLAWFSERPPGRPFFAFLNYCDAHGNYLPPEPFALKFSRTRPRGDIDSKPFAEWSPAEIKELNDAYDGAVAYLDDQLGRLVDALENQGTLKNTVVIVTSDHGEQFGEHNLLEHVNSLYPALLHVPLVIVSPPNPGGRQIDRPVSLRNVPATIFELIGLHDPVGFPGRPILWRDDSVGSDDGEIVLAEAPRSTERSLPEWYPTRRGALKSVVFQGWQYILNIGDGTEELFDLQSDPESDSNLAEFEDGKLSEYRRHLESVLSPSERRRVQQAGTIRR
ncbi:MAG: sulfatase [Vicinamibacterales bacterium]